ncbi:MAG: ABC-F family ATP-binding cassette domain-containing protein [Anaerolineales bacterium]|nr:ABC-F family ATP-binding cassette domain-containing protein [Anaerolineales bacterium]
MLKVLNLSKTYTDRPILRDVSFQISPGERVGLVGPNGCGKTTLLRLILHPADADTGQVLVAPGVRVGYLAQGLEAPAGATLQDCLDQALGEPERAEAELAHWAAALAGQPSDEATQQAYAAALARVEGLAEAGDPARAAAVLAHLGLGDVPLDWPITALSGGQKTRLGLALVLLSGPRLLLLDEPTNHLDLEMLAWLEDWLAAFRGAAVIVSHDRAFLDAAVTRILELDPRTQAVRSYPGNYADYLDQKQGEVETQWQAYSDWQGEIAQLRQAAQRLRGLAVKKKGGKGDSGDKFAKGFFNDQTTRMVRRAKHVEHRLEKLLTDDRVEKPKRAWQMNLAFAGGEAGARDVLRLEALTVGYDAPLLAGLDLLIRHGERVALVGPNGCGKTTLARTIAGHRPPLAGRARLGASVRLGYFAQEHDWLRPELNALETIRAHSRQDETALRHFLHFFLFEGDEVFTPIAGLSHGERARLALAALVAQGCNFLVLDEPINHLDIPSRERFEQALTAFPGTALIIAHDRYFIDRLATSIWKAAGGGVRVCADLGEALAGGWV